MRAILIDPYAQCCTEINLPDEGNLSDLYRVMGCQTVELVRCGDHIELWVDEEGRFLEHNGAFKFLKGNLAVYPDFVGPAVLLGSAKEKNGSRRMAGLDPILTLENVRDNVAWLRKGSKPFMQVVAFDGESCGGTWDGFTVGSDADPGM